MQSMTADTVLFRADTVTTWCRLSLADGIF
jgi:hypothetical protein